MSTTTHEIKVATTGAYDYVRIAATENEDGDVFRLMVSYWRNGQIGDTSGVMCESWETLYLYKNPEIEAVCHRGVWNLQELFALVGEPEADEPALPLSLEA